MGGKRTRTARPAGSLAAPPSRSSPAPPERPPPPPPSPSPPAPPERPASPKIAPAVPLPTSAQFSFVLRVRIDHRPGMLGRVATAIGQAGGAIGASGLIAIDDKHTLRDMTVDAAGTDHANAIVETVNGVEGAEVLDATDRTFLMHVGGKIEQHNKHPLRTRDDLSMAYTPGVARVCEAIAADRDKAFQYTIKRNTVAVVSDGSAVLGLGGIRPGAGGAGMGGGAKVFKEFGGVDAFPICLDSQDTDEIVETVRRI